MGLTSALASRIPLSDSKRIYANVTNTGHTDLWVPPINSQEPGFMGGIVRLVRSTNRAADQLSTPILAHLKGKSALLNPLSTVD